eukprot:532895-Prorocentrum_minimum.AAC.1
MCGGASGRHGAAVLLRRVRRGCQRVAEQERDERHGEHVGHRGRRGRCAGGGPGRAKHRASHVFLTSILYSPDPQIEAGLLQFTLDIVMAST